MQIRYNTQAMIANNQMKITDNKLSESIGRLSSGKKINHAKDNPSGLAMARRINKQLTSMETASASTKDGINIIKTTDAALSEVHDILQRMNELAVKAANGTLESVDRRTCQDEISQLKKEIERIGQATDFNGQHLLDGTFDLRGYATVGGETDKDIKISTYSDEMTKGKYTITGLNVKGDAIREDEWQIYDASGNIQVTDGDGNTHNFKIKSFGGNVVKLMDTEGKGQTIEFELGKELNGEEIELDLTHTGAMSLQVGANEGQILEARIPKLTLSNLGIFSTDVTQGIDSEGHKYGDPAEFDKQYGDGQKAAQKAISEIKNAIQYVSEMRSRLGAYQNRLEHTDSNLAATSENLTASYSTIMDVDMAEEMTEYSTQNVLSQAGISVLAQANEVPSQALQLLQ